MAVLHSKIDKGRNILQDKNVLHKISTDRVFFRILCLVSCIKLLLMPLYHSTDFEVHRNWLAITHSLPINKWYTNATSQWTLDYPPFFAWFEYFLSMFAVFFDPEMLRVDNLNYASFNAIAFQRTTVIIADFVYAIGVREIGKVFIDSAEKFCIFSFLSLANIGLWIVDHVHFQYNGFLLGILLISISRVSKFSKEGKVFEGAAWFAILLNLKHIYLYEAPTYTTWLFKWCLKSNTFFRRIMKLGLIVLSVFFFSFWPFRTQLSQVFSRLFPFKRGLLHAYWAANFWALYAGFDKLLSVFWKSRGWLFEVNQAKLTGGLVQEETFSVLPTPSPVATFFVTFVLMLPALWNLLFKKDSANEIHFLRCLVICGLSSFMLGWHVHEKAILTSVISMSALAVTDSYDARVFIILSSAGITALFPLLYPVDLTPLKIFLFIFYSVLSSVLLIQRFKQPLLQVYEWTYVGTLPLLILYETVIHEILFGKKLPFFSLAVTSVYCSLGITYSFFLYYYIYISSESTNIKRT